jgi:hypothetical protein
MSAGDCVIVGGRTLVGPMGRGVPRVEPAVHFAGGSRLVGSAVSTSKEPSPARAASRVVAGRARRASGPSPARQRALSLSTVGGRDLPRRLWWLLSGESHITDVGLLACRGPRAAGWLGSPCWTPSTWPGLIEKTRRLAHGIQNLRPLPTTHPARRIRFPPLPTTHKIRRASKTGG